MWTVETREKSTTLQTYKVYKWDEIGQKTRSFYSFVQAEKFAKEKGVEAPKAPDSKKRKAVDVHTVATPQKRPKSGSQQVDKSVKAEQSVKHPATEAALGQPHIGWREDSRN